MNYQATKRYGGNFNACYYVKNANLKRLHSVFQPYDILKRQNYEDNRKISGCQGSGGREG